MNIFANTVVSITFKLHDAQNALIEETPEPIAYLHGGYSGIFPKIEEALNFRNVGDVVSVTLEPTDAFEWLDALAGVLGSAGPDRAHYLIERLIDAARKEGAYLPFSANTDYINTIPADLQPRMPGDFAIEERIRNYARWNAMAMVVRANKHTNVGGHIASYASAAVLYDVGYNHFWRAVRACARRRSRR